MFYSIIKETPDYLVIDKPAGILVHGAEHLEEKTLADELLKDFPEIKSVGDDPWRPGIVHRLDKLVSGVMVIARNSRSFDHLKAQFQGRSLKKIYTALAFGRIEADSGVIDFPIARSRKGFRMAALPKTVKGAGNEDGRQALTIFKVEKHYINYTFLQVEIKTGRTHQIRVHLSAFGHPVVGDDLYSTAKTRIKNKKLDLGRIFLHASSLEFTDLENERQKFQSPLPAELETFLQKIK